MQHKCFTMILLISVHLVLSPSNTSLIVLPQFFPTIFHAAVFLPTLAVGTVTHLDLSWNDLAVEGGKAILDGMQAVVRNPCCKRQDGGWWHTSPFRISCTSVV